jgi:hypothetical protein
MKWKYETNEEKISRLSEWRKWFAWYPVYINGTAYWLTYVMRRDYVWLKTPTIWATDFKKLDGDYNKELEIIINGIKPRTKSDE